MCHLADKVEGRIVIKRIAVNERSEIDDPIEELVHACVHHHIICNGQVVAYLNNVNEAELLVCLLSVST